MTKYNEARMRDEANIKLWHRSPEDWQRPAFRKAVLRLTGTKCLPHPDVAYQTIKSLENDPERMSKHEYCVALMVVTGVWNDPR